MTHVASPSQASAKSEPSALEVAAILLRERQWTMWLPFGLAVMTALVVFLLPRHYTSLASFMPQRTQQSFGRLAGIAAQFGVDVPGQDPGESQEFYADLVISREILSKIVMDSFPKAPGGPSTSLVLLLGRTSKSDRLALEDAVKKLRRVIAVGTDLKTSIVTVSVTTRWAAVSAAILQRLIAEVNEFDLHTRQTQALAERTFVADRLAEARVELRTAEDQLQGFLLKNRDYRNSPVLQFQYDRLYRDVTGQQQLVTMLRQGYEQARIDEVRDTPRITVIERPLVPVRPDSRHGLLRVLLAGLVGIVFAWPAVLLGEALRRARSQRMPELDAVLEQFARILPFGRSPG